MTLLLKRKSVSAMYNITSLSGGFLVTNWLACEQQMFKDLSFSFFCRFYSKPTQLASMATTDF